MADEPMTNLMTKQLLYKSTQFASFVTMTNLPQKPAQKVTKLTAARAGTSVLRCERCTKRPSGAEIKERYVLTSHEGAGPRSVSPLTPDGARRTMGEGDS